MATIKVMPNQSMGDVIVQAMGTMEGGQCFCNLNGCALSDVPAVGSTYTIPDGSQEVGVAFDSDTMTDNGVLQYLGQNGIVIGNLSNGSGFFVTEDGSEDFVTEGGGENFVTE